MIASPRLVLLVLLGGTLPLLAAYAQDSTCSPKTKNVHRALQRRQERQAQRIQHRGRWAVRSADVGDSGMWVTEDSAPPAPQEGSWRPRPPRPPQPAQGARPPRPPRAPRAAPGPRPPKALPGGDQSQVLDMLREIRKELRGLRRDLSDLKHKLNAPHSQLFVRSIAESRGNAPLASPRGR